MEDELLSMFLPLIGVIAIILAAYWATNWYSKKYRHTSNGKYIKVLERTMLGQDKFLVMVETCGKVYLLGVSGQCIETIDTIDGSALPVLQESEMKADFAGLLSGLMSQQQVLKDKMKKIADSVRKGKE